MSLKTGLVVFVIFMIALLGTWADEPPQFLMQARGSVLQQELKTLQDFSGSYQLEKGLAENCPRGEVRLQSHQFHLGAQYKIQRINQGRWFQKGDCHRTLQSQLRGMSLVHRSIERCGQDSRGTSLHRIDFLQTSGAQKINLRVFQKKQIQDSHESSLTFQCIYRRKIKI